MSRALAQIKARRGRPRPTVGCPWSKAAKTRRLNRIQQLPATLPRRERAFYEDEVDIHLNPKIGWDWMVEGQQKEVPTPGKNQKRYLAGALEVRTRAHIWVEGERKTSYLFLDLLDKLRQQYPQGRRLHLILDNYRIHSSDCACRTRRLFGGQDRVALPATVLSGAQQDRARVARPRCQRHPQPSLCRYEGTHDGSTLLPPKAESEKATQGSCSVRGSLHIRAR
jgi:hypothetical protein